MVSKRHRFRVTTLAWSPDSTWLAAGGGSRVEVFEATTGQRPFARLGYATGIQALAWSPDGPHLASGDARGVVQVWETTTGEHLLTYTRHNTAIQALAWSPDGTRLASAAETTHLWDGGQGICQLTLPTHGPASALAWSPDGTHLFSAAWSLEIWETQTGQRVVSPAGTVGNLLHPCCVSWSPDRQQFVVGWDVAGNRTLQVRASASAEVVRSWESTHQHLRAVAWSPDGQFIASGGKGAQGMGEVALWEAATGRLVSPFNGHTACVYALAWSPDGLHLASGGADCTTRVWEP